MSDQKHDQVPVHAAVKVMLASEDIFFGPGVYQIMKEIDASGSVSEACRITGTYSSSPSFKSFPSMRKSRPRRVMEVFPRRKAEGGTVTP